MRVFNERKDTELFFYDLNEGFLKEEKLLTIHHPATEEKWEWVSDTLRIKTQEKSDEWDEYEDILVYVLFSQEQKNEMRASEIKSRLSQLSEDFIQSFVGAEIPDIEERKKEFASLHNELRIILGKTPRNYS